MSNEEKLVKMLKYVSEYNDFYKNRIKEYGITNPTDITQWPILTREELQKNRYNMFSDGYKSKYFNQQLRRQSSSGFSGISVNVYWDYKDWYASNMCLWRRRQGWYGIKPSDRYCVFTLNAFGVKPKKGELYYINKPSNILSFNVSLIRDASAYEQMVRVINDFNPKWLYIQPFVLSQLIQAYQNLNLNPPKTIRYIESVGEILTFDLRRRAEDLFHVKVADMYGSEEMNGIAIENLNGEMHILTDNVFFEVKNGSEISPTGNGEAIITNLNNYAMPFIRYAQEDEIITNKNNRLKINGRSIDDIEIDGKHLNTVFLCEIVNQFNNEYKDLLNDYRFEYDRSNNTLTIFVSRSVYIYNSKIKTYIELMINRYFVNIEVNVSISIDIYNRKRKIFKII